MALLTLHEALPGRYTQLAYARRVDPGWRRLLRKPLRKRRERAGVGGDAEEMALEQGYPGARDPGMVLTLFEEQMRITAGAVLDIRLHMLGMTRTRRRWNLLVKGVFRGEGAGRGPGLRRAKASSVQPAVAFVGWRAWSRLRREAEEARGAGFDLRAFPRRGALLRSEDPDGGAARARAGQPTSRIPVVHHRGDDAAARGPIQ